MTQPSHKQFPCRRCGAMMTFDPGAGSITCPYCGCAHAVPRSEEEIEELDFRAHLAEQAAGAEQEPVVEVRCGACGARLTFDAGVTADVCGFCGAPIVAAPETGARIRPRSLLPFAVTDADAADAFRRWIRGLWFAPRRLKRCAAADAAPSGVYVPYWTYDSRTTTFYRGRRGDDYWTTEHYTTTQNGRTVHRSRQVRRTRWTSVSGVVFDSFDDLLVLANRSLPRRYADRLEPWDLDNLTGYDESYLAGFRAVAYDVDLGEGFEVAREMMAPTIHASIRRDIGGDHQQIGSTRTQHDTISFKHVLLPVWLNAYRFNERAYRFLVNGRTGEVQGERPWSWVKIALAATAAAALIGAVAWAWSRA